MKLPRRVAVTGSLQPHAGSHRQPAAVLYTSYLDALEQAGLAPVPITPAHSAAAVASILSVCDGLVLTGGADVDPARYGAAPSAALGSVSGARDELEWRALDHALPRDLPVLGICRGAQVLNVFMGGTLYQDIATELPDAMPHLQDGSWAARTHDVSIVGDSLLRRVVGADSIRSNSFHHQAVKELAPGLRAAAHSADGLIEAVEAPRHAWVLAVQWHPERRAEALPATDFDRRLFDAFHDAVAQHGA